MKNADIEEIVEKFGDDLEKQIDEIVVAVLAKCKENKDTNPAEYNDVNGYKQITFEDIACDLMTREVEKRGGDLFYKTGIDPDYYDSDFFDKEAEVRYAAFDKLCAMAEYEEIRDYNDNKYLED